MSVVVGSLTTIFTPAPGCTDSGQRWLIHPSCPAGNNCFYDLLGPSAPGFQGGACFPPGYSPERTAYFSPAVGCPAGFTTACIATGDSGLSVTCCPTYESLACFTPNTAAFPWQSTLVCDQSYSGTTTISRITEISSNGVTDIHEPLVFAAPGAVNAYGIQIILGTPSTTTSSSTTTTTAANPGGPSQTTIASATDSSTAAGGGGGGGVSGGAVAGIAIGAAVGVLAACLLAFYLCFWRRRHRQQGAAGAGPGGAPALVPSPGHDGGPGFQQQQHLQHQHQHHLAAMAGLGPKPELHGHSVAVAPPQPPGYFAAVAGQGYYGDNGAHGSPYHEHPYGGNNIFPAGGAAPGAMGPQAWASGSSAGLAPPPIELSTRGRTPELPAGYLGHEMNAMGNEQQYGGGPGHP